MRNSTGQDIERPHYYSQYWLDVAEGRPTGQTAANEAAPETPVARHATAVAEPVESYDEEVPTLADEVAEVPAPAPAPAPRKASKQQEKKEPARVTSLSELARIQELMGRSAEMEDTASPNLEAADLTTEEPALVTDFDLGDEAEAPEFAAEDEEEPFADEDEFDEDEEEDEWGGGGGGGGRKPRKPTKPPRRDRPSRF